MKNVKDALKRVSSSEKRDQVISDIRKLQLADNCAEFKVASKLWIKKWSHDEETEDFCRYFEEEHIQHRDGWYEGIVRGYPKTNNGLESINGTIKKEATFREKLPLRQFMQTMFDFIKGWSEDRNPECPNFKRYSLIPTVNLGMAKKGYEWAKANNKIKFKKESENIKKFFVGANSSKVDGKEIDSYLNLNSKLSWIKFDTYIKCKEKIWVVLFNEVEWESSSCNCPIGKKEYICKHIIGIAINMKKFDPPESAKTDPLQKKRQVGRPKKVSKALIKD